MSPGRHQVAVFRTKLDATFARITTIDDDAIEVRADFARYLCVLLSGFLEKAVGELLYEHSRKQSGPHVQRFTRWHLERFQNASRGRILNLVGTFNPSWRTDLEAFIVDEREAAIGSVVSERHRIAHGDDSSMSFVRVSDYRKPIYEVVDHLADLVDPI